MKLINVVFECMKDKKGNFNPENIKFISLLFELNKCFDSKGKFSFIKLLKNEEGIIEENDVLDFAKDALKTDESVIDIKDSIECYIS